MLSSDSSKLRGWRLSSSLPQCHILETVEVDVLLWPPTTYRFCTKRNIPLPICKLPVITGTACTRRPGLYIEVPCGPCSCPVYLDLHALSIPSFHWNLVVVDADVDLLWEKKTVCSLKSMVEVVLKKRAKSHSYFMGNQTLSNLTKYI